MKIVLVVPNYPPHSLVGSWLTTHQWMRHLVDRGHEVRALVTHVSRLPYTYDGVDVRSIAEQGPDGRWDGPIPNWPIVHEHGAWADVIVSHCGDGGYGQGVANRAGKPSVRVAHSRDQGLTHGADLTIAVSQATADSIAHGPVVVCPPPIDPADYRTDRGDRVTLVNLSKFKGGDLFWQLADALPDLKFCGVLGHWGEQVLPGSASAVHLVGDLAVENVAVLATRSDMRDVYRETRVLLMPSVSESYGRVALEAACSGIPTIAQASSGLIEALGPAGIWCDRKDPDSWVRALRSLDDPARYEEASQAALARAGELDPQASCDQFEAAVAGVVERVAA